MNYTIKLFTISALFVVMYCQTFAQEVNYMDWKIELRQSDSVFTLTLTAKADSSQYISVYRDFIDTVGVGVGFELDSIIKNEVTIVSQLHLESDYTVEFCDIYKREFTKSNGDITLSYQFKTSNIKLFKGILLGVVFGSSGNIGTAYYMYYCIKYNNRLKQLEIEACE